MGYSLPQTEFARQLLLVVLFITLCGRLPAQEQEIMPLRDIKTGMTGFGKTVIQGTDIETFQVEILGILANNKINENVLISGKSILVKVSGKVIEKAGGIAAGMSGSPVYVNDRLIGGLSSGWVMTDHTVGLVTPIEEMLEIWDYPLAGKSGRTQDRNPVKWFPTTPIELAGKPIRTILEIDPSEEAGVVTEPRDPETVVFQRAATPILIQGLSGRATELLKRRFGARQIQVTAAPALGAQPSGSGEKMKETEVMIPGCAIGIQLARGDVNLTTLGTLTHRSGKRILGLAHPFLKKGAVSFLMTGADIHHSFSSVQMPFKIGAPTGMLGIITQDREKGVAGVIGPLPDMVPIQVDVTDNDLKRTKSINFQVVRDPTVFVSVVESSLAQALEAVIDREGQGTALMGIALDCSNPMGEQFHFRRENIFFSKSDIVSTLLAEITDLLEMIQNSDIEEVFPTRLLLKVNVEQRRRTLAIDKVEIKNTSITPGGTLDVWVTLRPFREKSIVRKAKIPIPHDISKENLTLTVFGRNNRIEDSEGTETKEAKDIKGPKSDEETPQDFDSEVRAWVTAPKNSDLLFQLTLDGDEMKRIKLNGRDLEIQPTNLVVVGRIDTTITLSED